MSHTPPAASRRHLEAPQSAPPNHDVPPVSHDLASRGERLAAVIVDSAVILLALVPGLTIVLVGISNEEDRVVTIGFVTMLLGRFGIAAYNVVLLTQCGQSVGKRAQGIRIVRATTGGNPGFVRTVLLRHFACYMPTRGMPLLGLADIAFIG